MREHNDYCLLFLSKNEFKVVKKFDTPIKIYNDSGQHVFLKLNEDAEIWHIEFGYSDNPKIEDLSDNPLKAVKGDSHYKEFFIQPYGENCSKKEEKKALSDITFVDMNKAIKNLGGAATTAKDVVEYLGMVIPENDCYEIKAGFPPITIATIPKHCSQTTYTPSQTKDIFNFIDKSITDDYKEVIKKEKEIYQPLFSKGDKVRVIKKTLLWASEETPDIIGLEGTVLSSDYTKKYDVDIIGRILPIEEESLELIERKHTPPPERYFNQEYDDIQGVILADKDKGVSFV